jgi:hypothetical protein
MENHPMMTRAIIGVFLSVAVAAFTAPGALAQTSATQPSAAPADAAAPMPASLPADAERVKARVIEKVGDAEHAPLGSDEWKPVERGQEYEEGVQIRTGVRSSVKLRLGDDDTYTAVVVDSLTRVSIAELWQTESVKRTRLDLGYGEVRGGVLEGGRKSDFTIENPTFTASKRGTWNFGVFYERGSERSEIFLLDRGLMEAIQRETGRAPRGVLPGERVTAAMRSFLDQAAIDKNVPVADILAQSDIEVAFSRLKNDGLGVTDPGQGRGALLDLTNESARARFAQLANHAILQAQAAGGRATAEGSFGTGRGGQLLITMTIQSDDLLVQSGAARPGQLKFRRQALEGWLQGQRGR